LSNFFTAGCNGLNDRRKTSQQTASGTDRAVSSFGRYSRIENE